MRRRTSDWETGLAQDLRSPAFAKAFRLAANDEGIPRQVVARVLLLARSPMGRRDRERLPSEFVVGRPGCGGLTARSNALSRRTSWRL